VGPCEPGQVGGELSERKYPIGRTEPGRVCVVPALMLDTWQNEFKNSMFDIIRLRVKCCYNHDFESELMFCVSRIIDLYGSDKDAGPYFFAILKFFLSRPSLTHHKYFL